MVAYRLYFLDGVNRFTRTETVEAASNQDAVQQARLLIGGSIKCEVWNGHRTVAKVTADDSSN